MGERYAGPPLTERERQVANLIGLGYTNRQIGLKLSITERTAGTHVQHILNKLGAHSRAQIASWSAHESEGALSFPPGGDFRQPSIGAEGSNVRSKAARFGSLPKRRLSALLALAVLALVLLAADLGSKALNNATSQPGRGKLIYEAALAGDGAGFSSRYTIGDPSASSITFVKGAVEYRVLKPGGNTGNALGAAPMTSYYAEFDVSVVAESDVEFWFDLTGAYTEPLGKHLVGLTTVTGDLQLAYFVDQFAQPLGAPVSVKDLQSGRSFRVAALVDPPHYQIYVDGRSVIDVQHQPSVRLQAPAFSIFGNGLGEVRLTGIRVYQLAKA